MSLSFGTDGIRGVANQELTTELSLALGRAAALVLCDGVGVVCIGRDTRRSGPMIQAALSAGFASAGVDVVDLGVLPTPAVAHMSALRNAPAAVISASHNPFADNGIKFFSAGGRKLSNDVETSLEAMLQCMSSSQERTYEETGLSGTRVGMLTTDDDAVSSYVGHLLQSVGDSSFAGLHVVLDCGNGAASALAGDVFSSVGAKVTVVNDHPDGRNINEGCGSTRPAVVAEVVLDLGADVGFAFDGDADRVIAADHTGAAVDGDQIIAVLALDAHRRGVLRDDTVVATVMSNLGFRHAMRDNGVKVHETPVGDRNVLEALVENGWSLGGEQSGHIIFPELATTGDGLLTALQVTRVMAEQNASLRALAGVMTRMPQVLRNVPLRERLPIDQLAGLDDAIAEVERRLGGNGRVLLRASGTEPVIRVMVEALTEDEAAAVCDELCVVVRSELSL